MTKHAAVELIGSNSSQAVKLAVVASESRAAETQAEDERASRILATLQSVLGSCMV
jgi:hypothetical protein